MPNYLTRDDAIRAMVQALMAGMSEAELEAKADEIVATVALAFGEETTTWNCSLDFVGALVKTLTKGKSVEELEARTDEIAAMVALALSEETTTTTESDFPTVYTIDEAIRAMVKALTAGKSDEELEAKADEIATTVALALGDETTTMADYKDRMRDDAIRTMVKALTAEKSREEEIVATVALALGMATMADYTINDAIGAMVKALTAGKSDEELKAQADEIAATVALASGKATRDCIYKDTPTARRAPKEAIEVCIKNHLLHYGVRHGTAVDELRKADALFDFLTSDDDPDEMKRVIEAVAEKCACYQNNKDSLPLLSVKRIKNYWPDWEKACEFEDPETQKALHDTAMGKCNIGVIPGTRVVIVDINTPDAHERFKKSFPTLEPNVRRTPGGGWQYWLACTAEQTTKGLGISTSDGDTTLGAGVKVRVQPQHGDNTQQGHRVDLSEGPGGFFISPTSTLDERTYPNDKKPRRFSERFGVTNPKLTIMDSKALVLLRKAKKS